MMIWNGRDKKIAYGMRTLVMGIVNLTPDSFSDGGQFDSADSAVEYALQLVGDGADILDLGAQSTRPAYTEITPQEEWERLAPVLTKLRALTDAPISVDTYFPFVAAKALAAGADIINDVSGNCAADMAALVREYGAGWVLMHSHEGGADEAKQFFEKCITDCNYCGIASSQLCFDPGIGFGKTLQQNIRLLARVKDYKIQGYPLLLGFSRKRVIGAISQQEIPKERLYGNIAADTAAIFGGADILRLHDVKHEIQGIRAADALKSSGK